MRDGVITVNNPSIWRPILSIEDAASAYIRAIEADYKVFGIFNVASANYTVGEIGDLVQRALERELGAHVQLRIKQMQDLRSYKVNTAKAENVLSFHPHHNVDWIVRNLIEHRSQFSDWDNPNYHNILQFKSLAAQKAAAGAPRMADK